MDKRPRIVLKFNRFDTIIQSLVWLTLGFIWGITLLNYSALPNEVPIHFNASGQVDGYGDKVSYFDLPVISLTISIGMFFLNKIPHYFNYLSEITINNALTEYTRATRMLRMLSLLVNITFLIIVIFTLKAADNEGTPGKWLLPFILGTLILIPVFMMLNWRTKTKKQN